MYVCELKLEGFRGVKSGTIRLQEHSVIIGRNNSGKTTISDALALLLGRERVARVINDFDFVGGHPVAASRFIIIGTLTGFSSDDPNDFPHWFNTDSGAAVCWWLPPECEVKFGEKPEGGKLAVQLAFTSRFDEELCEFESIRYFYDGPGDPFITHHVTVPLECLREIGMFYLPSERTSERILTFGSSTFIKVVKENDAIPGSEINDIKDELRNPNVKVDESVGFNEIVTRTKKELAGFITDMHDSDLVYRISALDTESVMKSLVPHIKTGDLVVPLSRHGAGVISLQLLLLLLEFGRYRMRLSKNFILLAEEPELHLHPAAQRRIVQRLKSACVQSIVTTHSPSVAGHYQPNEILFLRNSEGVLDAEPLLKSSLSSGSPNAFQKLFVARRVELCQAMMSEYVLLPEGQGDAEWMNLIIRAYETQELPTEESPPVGGVGVVPTQDANIVQTYKELRRVRPDIIPLVDGDETGREYVQRLFDLDLYPGVVIRLPDDKNREDLITWIIEPLLTSSLETLRELLGDLTISDKVTLRKAISDNKSNNVMLENLASEAQKCNGCLERIARFLNDVAVILTNIPEAHVGWTVQLVGQAVKKVYIPDNLMSS